MREKIIGPLTPSGRFSRQRLAKWNFADIALPGATLGASVYRRSQFPARLDAPRHHFEFGGLQITGRIS